MRSVMIHAHRERERERDIQRVKERERERVAGADLLKGGGWVCQSADSFRC